MAYLLIVRKKAEIHLADAYDWYEGQRTGLGSEFMLSTEAVFSVIQNNPELFSQKFRNVRIALTPRFPYGVFYFIDRNRIIVTGVFHLSRNPSHWRSF